LAAFILSAADRGRQSEIVSDRNNQQYSAEPPRNPFSNIRFVAYCSW
jgi:hypothetical protein